MLQDLSFTILYVDDMERSTRFYRDDLGMELEFQTNGWTQFKSNGASLVLHPRIQSTGPANGRVHITFRVDNMDMTFRELSDRGVKFLAPPVQASFGKHATFLDPDGNAVDLIEWDSTRVKGPVSNSTKVNDILVQAPEAMEVLEDHGIRICGGCIVLLNGSVRETAEYSGLSATETSTLVEELNEKVQASDAKQKHVSAALSSKGTN